MLSDKNFNMANGVNNEKLLCDLSIDRARIDFRSVNRVGL